MKDWNWGELPDPGELMLPWVTRYLDFGWNVMPIESGGKTPRLKTWEFLNSNTVTEEMAGDWWREWPHANIALICGKISGVVVLDIDDQTRFDSSLLGQPEFYTATSRTSRGLHLFFQYPKEDIQSFKGEGFDLQSDGKYVILPPSLHPSGKKYEWIVNPWKEIEPFASVPEWLLGKARVVGSPAKTGNGNGIKPIFSMESYFSPAQEGERNNAAARLAGYLFSQGREYEEVNCTLQGWNLMNSKPLSGREIRTVVESVYKKHQRGR